MLFSGPKSGSSACFDAAGVPRGTARGQWPGRAQQSGHCRGTGEGERLPQKEERYPEHTAPRWEGAVHKGQDKRR